MFPSSNNFKSKQVKSRKFDYLRLNELWLHWKKMLTMVYINLRKLNSTKMGKVTKDGAKRFLMVLHKTGISTGNALEISESYSKPLICSANRPAPCSAQTACHLWASSREIPYSDTLRCALTHLGLVSHICVMKNSPHFPSDAYMRHKSLYFSYRSRGRPTKQYQAEMS